MSAATSRHLSDLGPSLRALLTLTRQSWGVGAGGPPQAAPARRARTAPGLRRAAPRLAATEPQVQPAARP